MSQTAQATEITVVFTDEGEVNQTTVKYAKAMLTHLLLQIQALPGEYVYDFGGYESGFAKLMLRHMQVSLDRGNLLKVQIKTHHGNYGAITGYLELPPGVQVHAIYQSAARALPALNVATWKDAIDNVAPEPPPADGRSERRTETSAGAQAVWRPALSGQGVASAVPATPDIPRFRETTRGGGPLVASTTTGSTARNGLAASPASAPIPNGRIASMNAPMTDPTPLWVELLKLLLRESKRGKEGLINNAGVGKKATQLFPGKSAHELAPSVFPELRKRGWVRLVNREEGLYQVEQSFVDEHRLDIKLNVMLALEPLPRGPAAHKKLSLVEELDRLAAESAAREQKRLELIHGAKVELADAVIAAQKKFESDVAAAEAALATARTNGQAAVEEAKAMLAAHEKRFAKELKVPLSKKV